MGTPTSWLFGDAPVGRFMGCALTFNYSLLSTHYSLIESFPFFRSQLSAFSFLLPAQKIVNDEIIFVRGQATKPQHSKPM